METPKVLPIKDFSEESGKVFHEHLPDIGLGVKGKGEVVVLLSPRNTGKSTLATNLFLNPGFYGDPKSDNGTSFESTVTSHSDIETEWLALGVSEIPI